MLPFFLFRLIVTLIDLSLTAFVWTNALQHYDVSCLPLLDIVSGPPQRHLRYRRRPCCYCHAIEPHERGVRRTIPRPRTTITFASQTHHRLLNGAEFIAGDAPSTVTGVYDYRAATQLDSVIVVMRQVLDMQCSQPVVVVITLVM